MSKFDDAIKLINTYDTTLQGRAVLADVLSLALCRGRTLDPIAGIFLEKLGFGRGSMVISPEGEAAGIGPQGARFFTIRCSSRLSDQLAQAAADVRLGNGPLAVR